MAKLHWGERIATGAEIRLGCSAIIFDSTGDKILLTRRSDNGQWCLPGGGVDSGERVAECCAREVREETGLHVTVGRLVGVYSNPDMLVTYPDGGRYHLVALSFMAEVTGGALGLSEETTEVGYFTPAEIASMDLMTHHRERIADALTAQAAAFVR